MAYADEIVVTGMGAVTPLGTGVDAFRQGVLEGRSGVKAITEFKTDDMHVKIAGMVGDVDTSHVLRPDQLQQAARVVRLALVAAAEALGPQPEEVVGPDPSRVGVLLGVCSGGLDVFSPDLENLWANGPEHMNKQAIHQMMDSATASWVAQRWGLRGPAYCLATACATGMDSLGLASDIIRSGRADVMVAGGGDAAVTRFVVSAFANARALSRNNDHPELASRPFDKDRDGFVMGEGAAVFVLERRDRAERRRAKILARLCSYGATNDAHHLTAPLPDGSGLAGAMKMAMELGRVDPREVTYLSAHATSTEQGDVAEAVALKGAFGSLVDNVRVGATKSLVGHLLGGAGAVSSLAAILAVNEGILTPVVSFKTPDPECPVNVVQGKAVRGSVKYALANAAGFGGHNSTLLFGAP
jgi:3-oxoacyl-[acyl-carrier-protein] synthase II